MPLCCLLNRVVWAAYWVTGQEISPFLWTLSDLGSHNGKYQLKGKDVPDQAFYSEDDLACTMPEASSAAAYHICHQILQPYSMFYNICTMQSHAGKPYLKFDMKLVIPLHSLYRSSHQRWKQMRNRVCFHFWCELTLALWCHSIVWSLFFMKWNVTEWQVSWNSW